MQANMTPHIENEGFIKSMQLPNAWSENSQPRPEWAGPYWRNFNPNEKPKIRLSFFDRGRPVGAQESLALSALLAKAPATLTTHDLRNIGGVLRDAALVDEFNFLNARSEVFNGRPVIFIEGRWFELQEDCLWMITADEKCEWVFEVFYQAPKADYPLHLKMIRECLKTIEWL